jgi:hypothetical protein
VDNNEYNKYLMTFQNLLCRIPKWNTAIVEQETRRIIEKSGCDYLEDLITCVHIIQLKTLTAIRVGNKQKKIDISIPKLDDFIHKVYIFIARKLYVNIYLYEKGITPLQSQKNMRELELIIHECILNAIRESIPTEQIIRAYMDNSVEIEEEVIVESIPVEPDAGGGVPTPTPTPTLDTATTATPERTIDDVPKDKADFIAIKNTDNEPVVTRLTFNDIDSVLNGDDSSTAVEAPKDIKRLEEISSANFMQRKLQEEEDDDDNEKIKILSDASVDDLGIDVLDAPHAENLLDDIEFLG